MVPKEKGGLYNKIYIYIQIGAFVQNLPVIDWITKIQDFFLKNHKFKKKSSSIIEKITSFISQNSSLASL